MWQCAIRTPGWSRRVVHRVAEAISWMSDTTIEALTSYARKGMNHHPPDPLSPPSRRLAARQRTLHVAVAVAVAAGAPVATGR